MVKRMMAVPSRVSICDDYEKKIEKIKEINDAQAKKDSKCKYCKKPVVFQVVDIFVDPCNKKEKIKWQCSTPNGENHSQVCLGEADYKPKFAKGDIILSQWKEHTTMYIIAKVEEDEGFYELIYEKKRRNRNRIPIKTIDKKSNLCDKGMVEAIFG